MIYGLAVAPCTREVRVYGADRSPYTVLLRIGNFQWLTLIVIDARILTCRICSPTFAAFSFITLTRQPQYYHQQQTQQKLTDQSSLSSERVQLPLNEDCST